MGAETLEALGLPTGSVTQDSSSGDLALLARLISAGGRGEEL